MLQIKSDLPKGARLNYYSSLCNIKKWWIHNGQLTIPLTPLKFMTDSREGWGKLPLEYKAIFSSVLAYTRRVVEDGGTAGCPICVIKSLSNLSFLGKTYPSLESVRGTFSFYLDHLKSSAIRSFFVTNSLDEALDNRYMWALYGGMGKENVCDCDKPILLSFDWHTLRSSLEVSTLDLQVGLMDYNNDGDPLFYKDKSYTHEREFRIATKTPVGRRIVLDDKAQITAVIQGFNRSEEALFESLGFSSTRNEHTRLLINSKLDPESGHPDAQTIESVLSLLNTFDPDRWDQIMK